ncbi:NCS2 family permease [Acetilactobacillus jinshanensis]|uniref:NCS2 family permease n=1 Tax=Acetilactobacillus jinshanensis TaxID=1720083 RepID=A0A4P6ZLJ5_9LACO|nr:NCS2 family permease [Acetilactobacillus jinshanensis]QBP18453.1 NCS2 family permease [Acetilactobacillus jinshanensis]URL61324.1 NCS2 family permease [uncultured bacterium]
MRSMIAKYFHFKELGTNLKTETLAGITTFTAMAYILFVNPNVLGAAGMNKGAVFTATALASALGCFIMGIVANYPIALSSSLGINAFFAYSVCVGMHIPWQTALAGVFAASIIFVILTAFKIRELIINAIPADFKRAISGGIGLFIAFIGFQNGGLIVANKSNLVGLGSLHVGTTWLTVFGLVLTIVLFTMRIPAAIFIGMICTTILGISTKLIPLPTKIVSGMPSLKPTFLVALKNLDKINTLQLAVVVLTFLLVTFFDTAGTLVGLCEQAGLIKNNHIPRIGRTLVADSSDMVIGSLLGTSPMGAFVESSTGISMGGRSGFTVVVTGLLFIIGGFFSPLLSVITDQVTAPALIIVGILMAQSLAKINWKDFAIATPAFLIMIGIPLTYSVSDGIALGFIMYPITMLATKRAKHVNIIMYSLAIVFLFFMWILNEN